MLITRYLWKGATMIKLLGLVLLVFSSITLATDIQLTWETPTEREDGTAIQEIEKYNLYHTVNDVLQSVIEVDPSDTSYTTLNAPTGIHSFVITTVTSNGESDKSNAASEYVPYKAPSKPVKILLTVEILD